MHAKYVLYMCYLIIIVHDLRHCHEHHNIYSQYACMHACMYIISLINLSMDLCGIRYIHTCLYRGRIWVHFRVCFSKFTVVELRFANLICYRGIIAIFGLYLGSCEPYSGSMFADALGCCHALQQLALLPIAST